MKAADCHAHIFPLKIAEKAAKSIGDFYGEGTENVASAEILLEKTHEAGIEKVLVSNSAVTVEQVESVNAFLADECRRHPEFVGLGSAIPTMENGCEVLDDILAKGLKGIKIHSDFQKIPIDAPEALPFYRACAEKGLTVLFHMGDARYDFSSPERLKNLKRQVPDLVAIAAHFGGYRAWARSEACPQVEGIYYDTSSSLMFLSDDDAKRMLEKFGPERFLFGSDFPMWTPKTELERFKHKNLGLNEREMQTILYGNFEKLFLQ